MCQVPRCRQKDWDYIYYGIEVCQKCWDRECDFDDSFNLKQLLKIKEPEIETQASLGRL